MVVLCDMLGRSVVSPVPTSEWLRRGFLCSHLLTTISGDRRVTTMPTMPTPRAILFAFDISILQDSRRVVCTELSRKSEFIWKTQSRG